MTTSQKQYSRNKKIVHRIIDGEAVLVDPERGIVIVLNQTGSRIWELLAETDDLARIASTISSEFDVAPDTAESDTIHFIKELIKDDLVNQK